MPHAGQRQPGAALLPVGLPLVCAGRRAGGPSRLWLGPYGPERLERHSPGERQGPLCPAGTGTGGFGTGPRAAGRHARPNGRIVPRIRQGLAGYSPAGKPRPSAGHPSGFSFAGLGARRALGRGAGGAGKVPLCVGSCRPAGKRVPAGAGAAEKQLVHPAAQYGYRDVFPPMAP